MVHEDREAGSSARVGCDVTLLLADWENGDQGALDRLMPIVYDELRRIAARHFHAERPGHTLQTTALVHEAYLRLIDETRIHWRGRTHFYGIAARLIRNILVDHARSHNAAKRGGCVGKLPSEEAFAVPIDNAPVIVAVDDALQALAKLDPQQSRIVELKFFAGMTIEETAEVLGISSSTVKRDWILAKAWIYRALSQLTAQP